MNIKPEIIQQWQYSGKIHPELLEDEVLESCKKAGITSLQSYVLWSEVEKESGKFDFSCYDVSVEKLKKHNLKWAPFLIAGPNYATPKWFQESKESVFFKCLEHKKETKNQSIWNPYLPAQVERFLSEFSKHYDKDILESVELGISGNWGEAIYPSDGWFIGKLHVHLGWWCGDQHSHKSFVEYISRKYISKENLNKAWETNFSDFKEIKFPFLKKNKSRELFYYLINRIAKLPDPFKNFIKFFLNIFSGKRFLLFQKSNSRPKSVEKVGEKKNWLDFIEWYFDSMNNWAELWIKTARKYFPDTEIYLVTGGTGKPELGADLSRQVKIAKKYEAGIRITNQTNEYSQSFILTRLVASACRFYDSFFITEEAAVMHDAPGVLMRIFDAVSSGAKGFYCKNLISTGIDQPCIKRNLPAGTITEGLEVLNKNIHFFELENPIIKTAVFFPNTSIAFNSEIINTIFNKCSKIRDVLDLDLIDENMVKEGGLDRYQFIIVLAGQIPNGEVSDRIEEWVSNGGKLINGPKEEDLEFIQKETGDIDADYDGVYATRFADKILYYNSTNSKVIKKINFLNKTIEIEPQSILSINI